MVDLEDDEDDFLPALARPVFGAASSTTSLPDTDSYGHRANLPSDSSYPAKLGSTTPTRPALPKASASFSANTGHGFGQDARLGKFSNASSSSLATPGTSISSSLALTPGKKMALLQRDLWRLSKTLSNLQTQPCHQYQCSTPDQVHLAIQP